MQPQTVGRIVFLASLLCFLALSNSIGEWYVYRQMGFQDQFRYSDGAHVTSDVLDLYLDYAAKQKGYRIAVIGDSVIQGAGVPEREQTIPSHLEEALRGSYLPEARVLNFGLPGARPADLYMELKRLHQAGAAQLYIVNLSYPFFSDEMAQIPILYDKVWYNELSDEQRAELRIPPVVPPAQTAETAASAGVAVQGLEGTLQRVVNQYWSVYRFRQEINRFLFEGPPAVKGKEFFDFAVSGKPPASQQSVASGQEAPLSEKDRPENKYQVWTSFSWSEKDKEHLRNVFHVSGKENLDYKYYREILQYLEENNIPAVIFMSPVNHALLQKYDLLDYKLYRKNTANIQEAARQRGVLFFDYQEAVPPDLFHDSLHLLDGGNAIVAELLSRDLKPYLQGDLTQ